MLNTPRLALLVMIALATGLLAVEISSTADETASAVARKSVLIRDVPHIRQKPDFCGEACAAMYLRKLGRAVDQDWVFDQSGLDPLTGRGCFTRELAAALKKIGLKTGPVWSKVAAEDPRRMEAQWRAMAADLSAGVPSIVCMHYDDSPDATEHFRLIVGYDANTDEVIYHEPAETDGAYRRMKRTTLLKLWPLKYDAKQWTVIRLRLEPGQLKSGTVGTTFTEAIELAGGSNVDDPVTLVGGAMMGRFCDDLTTPITKTTGGLIVLDRGHPLVHRYTLQWKSIARIGASACDQCTFCTYFCPRYLLGHPIEPHKAMRSLQFNMVGEANVIGTQFCCECNLCTMIACPEDLDPKNVCTQNKRRLMEEGSKWQVASDPVRAEMHLENRRVPISRLVLKLGLSKFRNVGPLIDTTYSPKRVTLPLKQHAGAPADPCVRTGAKVNIGEVVAKPADGQLGAVIHASINGTVTSIDGSVVIEA